MNPPPRRPDDDPPAPATPPAGRDPLLDDPLFAELVEPADAGDDLPVAEVVRPRVDPPLPTARPVRPAVPVRREPSRAEPPPVGRSRPLMACCVLGCFGGAVLGSVALLAVAAVIIFQRIGDRPDPADGPSVWARPGPVLPTKLPPNAPAINLGGVFNAVGRGAGGRYLFLRIPEQQRLAVFDPNEGKLTDPLAVDDPKFLFAGGASRLFVYKPSTRTVERYAYQTWRREASAPAPVGLTAVDAIATGAGSDGPVYLFSLSRDRPADVRVLDAVTLTQIGAYPIPELRERPGVPVHARASDDGTVVTVAAAAGAVVLRFSAAGEYRKAVVLRSDDAANPTVGTPSPGEVPPQGHLVYTPRGVFTAEGTRVARLRDDYFFTLPTAHGSGLYLSLNVENPGKVNGPLTLHAAPSPLPSGSLDDVKFLVRPGVGDAGDVTADQRVHLWPAAGLVAVLPTLNRTIELHKVDVGAALRAGGGSYCVIGSDPPTTAVRDGRWSYTPTVWTRAPRGVQLELGRHPPGMVVSGHEIVWTPPDDQPAGPVDVQIIAVDANKTRTEQSFRLVVVDDDHD